MKKRASRHAFQKLQGTLCLCGEKENDQVRVSDLSDLAVEFCDVAIAGKIGIDECEEKIKENVKKSILLLKKRAKINITQKRL